MRLKRITLSSAIIASCALSAHAAQPTPGPVEPAPNSTPTEVEAPEPPPVAAELFRAGSQAFERGDFRAAALSFEQAYDHAPEPATAYAAALSWFSAGNKPRAADAYERALIEGSLDEARSTQARARFEALRKQLGVIRVLSPAGERASLGYRSAALIPFSVYVLPGEHQATLVTGRDPVTDRIQVKAGQVAIIRFSGASPAPKPLAKPAAVDSTRTGPSPWWGVAALGVATVSVGGALVFRSQALNSVERFETSGDSSDRDDALTQRALSYGFWGLAGVSAAAGVTLLLWPSDTAHAGDVAVNVHGTSVSGRVKF